MDGFRIVSSFEPSYKPSDRAYNDEDNIERNKLMQQSTGHLPKEPQDLPNKKEPQDLPKEPQDLEQAREEIGVFLIIQTYQHKTGHTGRHVSLPFDPDCASLTKLRT
jgi:hypothetical protein